MNPVEPSRRSLPLFQASSVAPARRRVILIRPPFFTPWAAPLGISLLKAHLESAGHEVRCYDMNVDRKVWSVVRRYFAVLEESPGYLHSDGHTRFWHVLNAHALAHLNGGANAARQVVRRVLPFFALEQGDDAVGRLQAEVEALFARLDKLFESIPLDGADLFGTSTYTTSLAASLHLLKRAKVSRPGLRTVIGGGVFADDLALGSDNYTTLEQECDFIDHIVIGEGERAFLHLTEGRVAQRRITIDDVEGGPLHAGEVPVPDFSDFVLDDYYHLSIEGGRSCPFQCSFCSETIQWGKYRKKSGVLLAEQMVELAKRYGNSRFFMGDSLVNPYIGPLSLALGELGASVYYDGYLRADKTVLDRARTRAWAGSGFYRARLGLETGSARLLEVMNKKTDPGVMSDALRSLTEAGVRTTTYWVVGHPGESDEDFEETLRFVSENADDIYELEAHPYCYYPYGQVQSRQFESRSLYPEEVTEVIRFRSWEIEGVAPSREVKFARLRRMAEHATALKLPNIYSMSQRYAAEERWSNLHPNAARVY